MAFDQDLAERIRRIFDQSGMEITEKKMFGGICFLLHGKMTVGLVKNNLMVRVVSPEFEKVLQEKHVKPMDFSGKPMKNFVYVEPDGLVNDSDLKRWLKFGVKHAEIALNK